MIKLSLEGERVLRDAVAAIEMDLEHWDQEYYVNDDPETTRSCGTTACLAGQIVANEKQMTLKHLNSWQHYNSIPEKAVELLGLTGDLYDEVTEASIFRREIFLFTHRDEDVRLATTPENLKFLKERIAEVTGIEL